MIYDPFGPIRQWDWGNSTVSARTFDQDGKVTQVDSAGLHTYSYDDAFRITGITDTANSALSWSYGYDSLDRLTSGSRTGLSQTWTYDANGNRLTQGGTTSSTFTISSSNNRLNSVSGALSRTYSYDSAGNTTGDGTYTFTYNDAGRMTAVSSGASATYSYNALGQRVKKTVSSTSTYFAYDEAGHLVGEYDGSGNLIQETVWLGNAPVATLRSNGSGGVNIFYVHTDHLNTPRRISRPSDNAILWRWDSDPFGTTVVSEDPDGDTNLFKYGLRFPGQYYDAEAGLNYNYFRDYAPYIGRYIQSDPIGLRGGINTYMYANSNSVKFVDPFGLYSCPDGTWSQELIDSSISIAFGAYVSVGRVNYTCRSRPGLKCSATQICMGGGPILGGGVSWNAFGRQYGMYDSNDHRGWSGWNVTGSIGPVSGTANVPGPGGNVGAGFSIGAGLGLLRCINVDLRCTEGCKK